MTRTLVRGQRLKISDLELREQLELRLNIEGPRAPLYLLAAWQDERDHAVGWDYAVFGGGPRVAANGSLEVRHAEYGALHLGVNLAGKPASAVKLCVALAFEDRDLSYAENARAIQSGRFALGAGEYAFSSADFGLEKTLLLGEFYLKDGVWRFRVVGEGFVHGIKGLLERWTLPAQLLPPLQDGGAGGQAPQDSRSGGRVHFPEAPRRPLRLPQAWTSGTMPRIPSGLSKAVGFILVKDVQGRSASGTGFLIHPDGYLLTCAHVLEDAQEMVFRLEGTEEFRPLEVLAYSDEHDVALARLTDGRGAADFLLLERDAPELGDDLGLLGYPLTDTLGEGITYTQGIVNGIREKDGIPYLQIDTGAAPGMSGGPIFKRHTGRVLGLISVVFRTGGGMLLNLGVDIRNLWRLGWVEG